MSPRRRPRQVAAALAFVAAAAFIYRDVFFGRVLAGRDVFRLFIPQAHFLAECFARRELPLWIPYERLGQPFAAIPYAQAFYLPNDLAVLLTGPVASVTALHLFHLLVAAAGTFAACRALRASFFASAFGAAAFSLSHLFTLMAFAPNVAGAAAWTGVQLAALRAFTRRPSPRSTAALAAAVSASLLCGSPETTLWQGALLLACTLTWRRSLLPRFAAVVALGAAAAAVMLLPALELTLESTRTSGVWKPLEWSTSWSQLASIGWPLAHLPMGEYRGGSDQHYLTSLFMGSVVVALAALGASRRRRALPLATSGAALAVLSLGANFLPSALLLELPPFSFFRYPVKYVVGACFCLAVLAALGLDRAAASARRLKPSARALGVISAAALGAGALGAALGRALPFGPRAGWLWLVAALWAGALAWRLGGRRRWPVAAVAGLELLAAHLLLGRPAFVPATRLSAPSRLAAAIVRPFDGRVSVPVPDEVPVDGDFHAYLEASRDALMPLRFVEEGLRGFEGYGDPEPARTLALERGADRATYDLTGVRYFVRSGPPPFDDLAPVASVGELATLYESATAKPRAFVEAPCESKVALDEPRFTELRLDVDACAAAPLVISDAWFPGWQASLDGAPAELAVSHGALREVSLPAGRHHLTLRYRPWPFYAGAGLSLLASLVLIALALRAPKTRTPPPQKEDGVA
ncbi:MAG: hypothetical protein IPJ65_18730 [Archangiaceae bacterium]|nr:hypothetical protein [Archangiaceae bacterium]